MSTESTYKTNISQRQGKTRLSVEKCKNNLKSIGVDEEKIDLIESNLRAIINKVFDELENE